MKTKDGLIITPNMYLYFIDKDNTISCGYSIRIREEDNEVDLLVILDIGSDSEITKKANEVYGFEKNCPVYVEGEWEKDYKVCFNRCPHCGSGNIDWGSYDGDGNNLSQRGYCLDCDCIFDEIYGYSTTYIVHKGNIKTQDIVGDKNE